MNRIPLILLTLLIIACSSGEQSQEQGSSEVTDSILILNKSGNTAWQLDATTGDKITEYQTGIAPHEVAVSPDKSRAVITNYGSEEPANTLTVINLNTHKVDTTLSLGQYERPHGIKWFSDGKRVIVTAESQQAVLVVDVNTGDILSTIKTDQQVSHMVELSGDKNSAFVTNLGSGSVSILDLANEEVTATLQTGDGTEGVTFVPDKQEVWITNRAANTVSILNPQTNEIVETMSSSDFPIRAEVSPDGNWVAVSNARSSEVTIFDVENREPLVKVTTVAAGQQGMPIGLTFSDDNSRLYVANSEADNIAVFNTQNWKKVNTFKTGATPDGIAYINPEK